VTVTEIMLILAASMPKESASESVRASCDSSVCSASANASSVVPDAAESVMSSVLEITLCVKDSTHPVVEKDNAPLSQVIVAKFW